MVEEWINEYERRQRMSDTSQLFWRQSVCKEKDKIDCTDFNLEVEYKEPNCDLSYSPYEVVFTIESLKTNINNKITHSCDLIINEGQKGQYLEISRNEAGAKFIKGYNSYRDEDISCTQKIPLPKTFFVRVRKGKKPTVPITVVQLECTFVHRFGAYKCTHPITLILKG